MTDTEIVEPQQVPTLTRLRALVRRGRQTFRLPNVLRPPASFAALEAELKAERCRADRAEAELAEQRRRADRAERRLQAQNLYASRVQAQNLHASRLIIALRDAGVARR
jgi:hypothetical protein